MKFLSSRQSFITEIIQSFKNQETSRNSLSAIAVLTSQVLSPPLDYTHTRKFLFDRRCKANRHLSFFPDIFTTNRGPPQFQYSFAPSYLQKLYPGASIENYRQISIPANIQDPVLHNLQSLLTYKYRTTFSHLDGIRLQLGETAFLDPLSTTGEQYARHARSILLRTVLQLKQRLVFTSVFGKSTLVSWIVHTFTQASRI